MGNQLEMQNKAVELTQESELFTEADISEGWGDGLSKIFSMTKLCCDCRCKSGFMSGLKSPFLIHTMQADVSENSTDFLVLKEPKDAKNCFIPIFF